MQRLKDFLGRRLSPEEDLGLHLTIGLVLSFCLLGLFAAITHAVEAKKTEFDDAVGLRLQEHRVESPRTRGFVLALTQFGSFPVLTTLAIGGSLLLLLAHRRLLALVWLLAPAGGGLLNAGLKEIYQRDRPYFIDPALHDDPFSFPSGHSLASLISYGLLAYVLVLFLPRLWLRLAAIAVLLPLPLAIGFSRIYLGAHYVTDVMGGFAVGGFWLAACVTAMESVRRKHRRAALAREAALPAAEQ